MAIDGGSGDTAPEGEQLSSALADLQMETEQSKAGGENMDEQGGTGAAVAAVGDVPHEEERTLVLVTVRIPRQASHRVSPSGHLRDPPCRESLRR
jgi:hypothetical protein